MTLKNKARPRAAALLMAAAALPSIAWAQEVAPPVVPTTAQPASPPVPVQQPTPVATRPAPVTVQPTPERPVYTPEQIAESEASLRPAQPRPSRPVARPAQAPRAVTRAVPGGSAATVPQQAEPVAAPVAAAPIETPAPVVAEEPSAAPTGQPTADAPLVADPVTDGTPWSWIVGGLVALAALVGLIALLSRRRRAAYGEDAAYDAPRAAAAPLVAPQHDAPQPVAPTPVQPAIGVPPGRPWLRMTLQPTGVEAIGDGNTLFYDLIVENEGSEAARDVRVKSFLFGDSESSAQERALIVPVGASRPVSASVLLPANGEAKVVADIRYPLPDGTEGHVAARFAIDARGDAVEATVDRVIERV
jgi:hypothetical protein